jgi:hypothetical protein
MPNIPEMPQPAQEGGDIEQMLAQLSPEELQQLAAQLGSEMQDPSAGAGGDEVSELANAIEQHLAQNPEAAVDGAEPEKMAALRTVKSAGYIEGFIHQAVMGGANLKQAVDMYDNALTSTIFNLKQAALKGDQHKLDLNNNGKIDSSDLKNLRHEKSETPNQEKKEHMNNDMEEVKEAAYYEGVFERAAEYGFSKQAAVELLYKIAGPFDEQDLPLGAGGEGAGFLGQVTSLPGSDFEDKLRPISDAVQKIRDAKPFDYHAPAFGGTPFMSLGNAATPEYIAQQGLGVKQFPDSFNLNNPNPNAGLMEKIQNFIKSHKSGLGMGALGLGAAGLGAGAYALANRKSNKEKKGSLEDEIALSLGQEASENPNSLGSAMELGNITPSGMSDADRQLAEAAAFSKGMGGTNNPFLLQNRGGYEASNHIGIDSVNADQWDQAPYLKANTSLQDTKMEHLIRQLKGMARPAALGLGAAGLGAGAAYGLSRGKDKRK